MTFQRWKFLDEPYGDCAVCGFPATRLLRTISPSYPGPPPHAEQPFLEERRCTRHGPRRPGLGPICLDALDRSTDAN